MKQQIKEFINALSGERGYSSHTCRAYRTDLLEFMDFLIRSDISLDLKKNRWTLHTIVSRFSLQEK